MPLRLYTPPDEPTTERLSYEEAARNFLVAITPPEDRVRLAPGTWAERVDAERPKVRAR